MTSSGRLSGTDLQNLTFSRRDLLKKLSLISTILSLPRPQLQFPVTQIESSPNFKLGDVVASDWVDDFGENFVDFGEVLGVRYFAKGQSSFAASTWVYYVNWTHSTCGLDFLYPCYDQEASRECDLRLVKQY